ncbi:MAG: hypothetical protein HY673_00435 [Chloroflexi bacterium]|nr:hypothetical protein [Chloroflexota bacterium]
MAPALFPLCLAFVAALSTPVLAQVGRAPPPVIKSVSVTSVEPGKTHDITILGDNFVPGATVSFSPPAGITVASVRYVSPQQLIATVSAASDAPAGPRDVVVRNPDGQSASLPKGLTVTSPPPAPPLTPGTIPQPLPTPAPLPGSPQPSRPTPIPTPAPTVPPSPALQATPLRTPPASPSIPPPQPPASPTPAAPSTPALTPEARTTPAPTHQLTPLPTPTPATPAPTPPPAPRPLPRISIEVVRVFVDEDGRKEVLSRDQFESGAVVRLPAPPVLSPGKGVQHRPVRDAVEIITVTGPATVSDEYTTFYELSGSTAFGSIDGVGWYRKGDSARWSVSPAVINHDTLGFLGVVFKPRLWSGAAIMDAPKQIAVEWYADYLPLFAVASLIAAILLPCYRWPPWRPPRTPPGPPPPGRPPRLPPEEPPRQPPMGPERQSPGRPTAITDRPGRTAIWDSRIAKKVGAWAPVGTYVVPTMVSAYTGLSKEALVSVTITGVLLGVITTYKSVSCLTPPGPPVRPPTEPPTTPPVRPPKRWKCGVSHEWIFRKMDLAVWPEGAVRAPADDPLPLKARAWDTHVLVQRCSCNGVSSNNHFLLANVRYEWEILSGEGGFIRINDGTESRTGFGEQVLYQPPDVQEADQVKSVLIKITAHHDDATKPPEHGPCVIIWNIEIKREINEVGPSVETPEEFVDPGDVRDEYVYSFTVSAKQCPAANPFPEESGEGCMPQHEWRAGSSITGEIKSPPGPVCSGDYIRLEAIGKDVDELKLMCLPAEPCIYPAEERMNLNDLLEYEWAADRGRFPNGSAGREVVWQAPDEKGEVRFSLTIRDSGGQFDDGDLRLWTSTVVLRLGIDLVETPRDWLPDARAGSLSLPARVYMCQGNRWVFPGRKKFVSFRVKKISREKGVCMNYPIHGNTNPDLFFHEGRNGPDYILRRDRTVSGVEDACPQEVLLPDDNPGHKHHYLYTVSRRRRTEAATTVRCEDYGAVGRLEARANHCIQIPPRDSVGAEPCNGSQECCTGSNEVNMPRDDNGNDIADSAPQDAGGTPAGDDDPYPPGNRVSGDGFSNYEEYRGFVVVTPPAFTQKRHVRTDINRKTVFLHVLNSELLSGVHLFRVVTNLEVYFLIHKGYYQYTLYARGALVPQADGNIAVPTWAYHDDNMVVNYNRGRHSLGRVYGILVMRDDAINLPNGFLMGVAIPRAGAPAANGPPAYKDCVKVNVPNIVRVAGMRHIVPAGLLSATIAHEICHSVNVWHHGDIGAYHANSSHGNCHHFAGWPGHWAQTDGDTSSGDVNCVMRYFTPPCGWCHATGHHFHGVGFLQPIGQALCTGNTGTNSATMRINDFGTGHRNDASRNSYPGAGGNGCLRQICVKD